MSETPDNLEKYEPLLLTLRDMYERHAESIRVIIDEDEDKWHGSQSSMTETTDSANLDGRLQEWRATTEYPVAARALNLYKMLIFGPGFQLGVKPRIPDNTNKEHKKVSIEVAAEWDSTMEANIGSWSEDEFVKRVYRDGEEFTVFDAEAGDYVKCRFIDAEEIYDKDYRQNQNGEVVDSKGIVTNPLDVTEPLYYTRYRTEDSPADIIPASNMLHVKIDCDSNEKRGRSRFDKLFIRVCQLDEFATVEFQHRRAQASIVLHRKVAGGKNNANLVLDAAQAQYVDNSLTPVERVPPGTTVTTNPNIELEFKSPEGNYNDATILGAWLIKIVCQRTGFSYEMLSADMSQGNLATAQIGESPVSQMIAAERKYLVARMAPLFRAIIDKGLAEGRISGGSPEEFWKTYKIDPNFTPAESRDLQKVAQAYNLGVMTKALSQQAMARALGEDPDQMDAEIQENSGKDYMTPDSQLPGPGDTAASSKSNAKQGGSNSNGSHSDNKGSGKT